MDKKKIFFTYTKSEKGIELSKICFLGEDGKLSSEDFSLERHGELFKAFVEEHNLSDDSVLEENGIFDEESLNEDKLFEYVSTLNVDDTKSIDTESDSTEKVEDVSVEHETDNHTGDSENAEESSEYDTEDDYVEEDEKADESSIYDTDDDYIEEPKEKSQWGKRIVAGALAGASIVGVLALAHSCQKEQVVDQNQNTQQDTLEDLLNKMTPEQKAFFSSAFTAVETFNTRTTEEDNFKKYDDKSTLSMSVDEMVALNMMLNDYSSDDLYKVFGTVNYNASDVMDLARSAYSKLTTYYMNATKPSGIAEMINDETARAFFEKHENAVLEFNANPTTEKSDVVIKGLYYDYVHVGASGNYTSIKNNGVAWLATSCGFGFELANRNVPEFLAVNEVSEEEKEQYGLAAITVGTPLSSVTESELLSGINEEVNIGVMDEIDNKSLCASVTKDVTETINELTSMQQMRVLVAKEYARENLIEGLKTAGNLSLANKVTNSEITSELLNEISATNSTTNELVDAYNARINELYDAENSVIRVMDLARAKYNSNEKIDIADLVNNRFRTKLVLEKEEDKVDTTPGVTTEEEKKEQLKEDLYVDKTEDGEIIYDGDKLNELPKEEKDQFIIDNGTIVDKKEDVVIEEKVEEEDLTTEEKVEVDNQKEILTEIESLSNSLREVGIRDAESYMNEKGTYDYTLMLPGTDFEINTDGMTTFTVVAYANAFGDTSIDSNDKQFQSDMNTGAKEVMSEIDTLSDEAKAYLEDKYGSNWEEDFIAESYKSGYTDKINDSIKSAKGFSKSINVEELKQIYDNALKDVNEKNSAVEDEVHVTTPPVQEEVPIPPVKEEKPSSPYDPNLDRRCI